MHHHPISTSTQDAEGDALLPEDNARQRSVRSTRAFSRWAAHPFWYVCHVHDATRVLTYICRQADPCRPRILHVRKSCPHWRERNTRSYVVCSAVSQCRRGSKSTRPSRVGHSLTTQQTLSALLTHQIAKAQLCRPRRQKYRQVRMFPVFRLGITLTHQPGTLSAVVTLMSVLSAITTGPWSRLGDSHGRKPILIIFLAGAIAMSVHHGPTSFHLHSPLIIGRPCSCL